MTKKDVTCKLDTAKGGYELRRDYDVLDNQVVKMTT